MQMNWNDLKVFLAIANHGHLAGAARALGHNHSTVFRRLNGLEADLDTRLFERLPQGYVLTPAGERMRELAQRADQAVCDIQREIVGRDTDPSGMVRLTTAPNLAQFVVPRAVLALRTAHPNIVVEVAVSDSDYDLSRREADIAMRATTKPPEHLVGRRLGVLDWWLCGSAQSGDEMSDRPLDECSFIGADAALMRLSVMQWLESHYRDHIVARANDLSTMAALAAAGVGLAPLPSDQSDPALKRVYRIPEIQGELWLLTHPDLRSVRRVQVVWEALARAAQSSLELR